MNLLGQNVIYTDTRGRAKVAVVTGTRDSVAEGTSLPRPQAAHAHLHVFSHKQGLYARLSVPARSAVVDNEDFSGGGFFETAEEWSTRQAALQEFTDIAAAAAESIASGTAAMAQDETAVEPN
jgi:hypothetical protein